MTAMRILTGAVLVIVCGCCLAPPARAGDFAGLTPGTSKRTDVERTLGKPLREVTAGRQYDYDPARHDAARISVQYQPDGTVAAIDLYPRKTYGKAQYRSWFKLSAPASSARDVRGRLIEYYLPAGIALHFQGANDTTPVEYFSHYDLLTLAGPAQAAIPAATAAPVLPTVTTTPSAAARPAATSVSYLGISIAPYEGQGILVDRVTPNSPAAQAGLQPGDILIELGSAGFYESSIETWRFVVYAAALPVGRPVPLLVQRAGREFTVQVTPQTRTLDAKSAHDIAAAYELAGRWRQQSGDPAGAAAQFERAIAIEPTEPYHYAALASIARDQKNPAAEQAALMRGITATQFHRLYRVLGVSYRDTGRYPEAIEAFQQAVRRAPADARDADLLSQLGFCYFRTQRCNDAIPLLEDARRLDRTFPPALYFLARCHDVQNHRAEAAQFYRAFLALEASDVPADWTRLARDRLAALSPQ